MLATTTPPEALVAVTSCGAGGRFSRCLEPVVTTCIYCGNGFCASHTYHLQGYETVCTRKACRRKRDDIVRHEAHRARVQQRNGAGLCGEEGCGPHPGYQCSLCQGVFCERHLAQRMYPVKHGSVTLDRPLAVCAWCWGRRKIWRH